MPHDGFHNSCEDKLRKQTTNSAGQYYKKQIYILFLLISAVFYFRLPGGQTLSFFTDKKTYLSPAFAHDAIQLFLHNT